MFRQVSNQPLQQTAAAMLISESSLSLSVAAAAELGLSAPRLADSAGPPVFVRKHRRSVGVVQLKMMNKAKLNLAAWAGMIGSTLFVSVFVLEDFLRPNFNWLGTAVSEHALGPYSWIQVASFIVVGLLFLAFARGVAEKFRGGKSSKLGPLFLTILGVCILASGPFVTDPAPIAAFSSQATWHGMVHGVLGAIGFTLMPLSCFVFYRCFRTDPKWRALASWTLVAGIVIILAIVLLKVAQLGLLSGFFGLFQRIVLVAYFGWTFAFATGLRSQNTDNSNAIRAGFVARTAEPNAAADGGRDGGLLEFMVAQRGRRC